MQKLIIALDGQHFPKGAFEFVKNINLKTKVLLAGVFLTPVDYSKLLASKTFVVALMPFANSNAPFGKCCPSRAIINFFIIFN